MLYMRRTGLSSRNKFPLSDLPGPDSSHSPPARQLDKMVPMCAETELDISTRLGETSFLEGERKFLV
jgi:hypothetical protein